MKHRVMRRLFAIWIATLLLSFSSCGAPVTTLEVGIERTPTRDPNLGPDCTRVEALTREAPDGQKILADLLAALPARQSPDLQQYAPYEFDEVWSIHRMDDWAVVQGTFKAPTPLEPGGFVVQRRGNSYQFEGVMVPRMAESRNAVVHELVREAPKAPVELFQCVDFSRWVIGG